MLVTRSDELDKLVAVFGKTIKDKYGASTTHMSKLLPRIDGGGAAGCPILVLGIKSYVDDEAPPIPPDVAALALRGGRPLLARTPRPRRRAR